MSEESGKDRVLKGHCFTLTGTLLHQVVAQTAQTPLGRKCHKVSSLGGHQGLRPCGASGTERESLLSSEQETPSTATWTLCGHPEDSCEQRRSETSAPEVCI